MAKKLPNELRGEKKISGRNFRPGSRPGFNLPALAATTTTAAPAASGEAGGTREGLAMDQRPARTVAVRMARVMNGRPDIVAGGN